MVNHPNRRKPILEGQPEFAEREQILQALATFIRQKPGLEPGNYFSGGNYRDNLRNYNAERRSIHTDLKHAEKLLAAVRWRTSIGADQLKEAFKRAFSGRLSWNGHVEVKGRKGSVVNASLSYCTGQYFPTEYRKAACAVLASALWYYWREGYATGMARVLTDGANPYEGSALSIRKSARKEFGLEIAKRYFDYRAEDYR